jgi:hypothetical protein
MGDDDLFGLPDSEPAFDFSSLTPATVSPQEVVVSLNENGPLDVVPQDHPAVILAEELAFIYEDVQHIDLTSYDLTISTSHYDGMHYYFDINSNVFLDK